MSSHFNIALYPKDPALAETLTALAARNLSGQTDQYLLGKHALPHVSLGQFVGELVQAREVGSSLETLAPEPLGLQFSHIFIRPGLGKLHQGKNWVGLAVVPTKALIDLQLTVYGRLRQMGIECSTDPDKYFPHLTFGRLARACAITISAMPPADFWQVQHPFEISLGKSNQNGVFIERLY
jgi:2'-5' RNA ligase